MLKLRIVFLVLLVCIATAGCQPENNSTPDAQTPPASETDTPTQDTQPPEPQGKIITVTSQADSGPGSLRQAMEYAQPHDQIIFDPTVFPPEQPVTINLASNLPEIAQGSLTIDGSNAGVILNGSEIPTEDSNGINISSNNNIIRGLQIIDFSGWGLALYNGAQYNLIGGDNESGDGLLGQGNLVSGNRASGILLWGERTSYNIIQGNYIGTDVNGTLVRNSQPEGIFIGGGAHNEILHNLIANHKWGGITLSEQGQGPSHNVIGPGNIITNNGMSGIQMYGPNTINNSITHNQIYNNDSLGIDLWGGGNLELTPPIITDFNLQDGTISGLTVPNATVEIFSTPGQEGKIYEGQVTSDISGYFAFEKGDKFAGPHLTATATDVSGNTSEFSLPTGGESGSASIQFDNDLPITYLETFDSNQLEDNHIGSWWHSLWGYDPLSEILAETLHLGVKRYRFVINGGDADKVEWDKSEFSIDPGHDEFITSLADNGIQLTYNLVFWDIATWPGGEGAPCPRFKTEDDIQRYLEYVRFAVNHFKDRVQYFEIWNEPDVNFCPQWIEPQDYIELVRRTVPVIRQEYPEAKIVIGATTGVGTYLYTIIDSDIVASVDVISWHPLYGDSPEHNSDYYYAYPSIVQQIKDTASSHGFEGEYEGDEMNWRPYSEPENEPNRRSYGEIVYAKYWARGILMNLGLDVTAGNLRAPHQFSTVTQMVRNLSTVMAGADSAYLPVEIQSEATHYRKLYVFYSRWWLFDRPLG